MIKILTCLSLVSGPLLSAEDLGKNQSPVGENHPIGTITRQKPKDLPEELKKLETSPEKKAQDTKPKSKN